MRRTSINIKGRTEIYGEGDRERKRQREKETEQL